jgi:Domain of unknown function (DUF4832)/Domain of unknown function (DUF4874)
MIPLKKICLPLICLSFLSFNILIGQTIKTLTYVEDTTSFPNPERGFYHHTETHSTNYSVLNETILGNYRKDNVTLVLRLFYLENFVNTAISDAYLSNMEKDFNALRNAGVKAVVRFAYTLKSSPPYGDAPLTQVQAHITQVSSLLKKHSDVIAVVQAGFIGAWGEWYYTDYFSQALGSPSNTDWANRRALVNALAKELPTSRMIQIRTPDIKRNLAQSTTPLTSTEAFTGIIKSRLAHHNDCFLASPDDYGTYDNLIEDKKFLEEETKYLAMGGETCAPNVPLSECPNAIAEMKRFHWSFLNQDYHPTVLSNWKTNGCYKNVERSIGYRYRLTKAALQDGAKKGETIPIKIEIVNNGWANPYNARSVELILRNKTSGERYYFPTSTELRKFSLSDTIKLAFNITLPTDMVNGQYQVYLNLPDPETTLNKNAKYSIHLANKDVWEDSTGYNNLKHQIAVNVPVSTKDVSTFKNITISPNPFSNTFRISSDDLSPNTRFSLMDLQGKILSFKSVKEGNDLIFDGSRLPSGLLLLRIITDNNSKLFKLTKF